MDSILIDTGQLGATFVAFFGSRRDGVKDFREENRKEVYKRGDIVKFTRLPAGIVKGKSWCVWRIGKDILIGPGKVNKE